MPLRRQLGKGYRACTAYGDFRDLIHRKDLDVVGIATPDHWHVIPAIMAAKAGKDVICEKPLTLTVAEGRILCDVMKQTGRIFQTASENRSIDTYIRCVELVRNGRIGQLRHIKVSLPAGNESSRGTTSPSAARNRCPRGSTMRCGWARHRCGPMCLPAAMAVFAGAWTILAAG